MLFDHHDSIVDAVMRWANQGTENGDDARYLMRVLDACPGG